MRRIPNALRRVGAVLLTLILIFTLVYALLPKGPNGLMAFDDPWNQDRPLVQGQDYMVAAGTPQAADVAAQILEKGGNAFDAAAGALLMLNVTHGEAASFPGIAPLVIYDAKTGTVRSYIGAGKAPAAATIEKFEAKGYNTVPDLNIWAQLVPASPDVIVSLLRDYGTLSFAQVAAPAIQAARDGVPVNKIMARNLDFSLAERIGLSVMMPYNAQVYMGGQWWHPVYYKDRLRQPDLATSLQSLSDAESAVIDQGGDRAAGLQAVRDSFYKGPLADAILKMHQAQGGLFTAEDLANYSGGWEEPVQASFHSGGSDVYTFYTNGTWSQGITGLETLKILDGVDLKSLGRNTPAYVHKVDQAIELAMADREAYVADPAFVKVPVTQMLSDDFAAQRRAAMTASAFGPLPAPGTIPGVQPGIVETETAGVSSVDQFLAEVRFGKDTTQLEVVDRWGNAVSLTPSDFPKSPMVPGTGLTLGDRMTQFRLDPKNVDRLEPGKRPRVTPHAVIVFKNGKFHMTWSTPGDDMQTQALVQVFLNMTVFNMDLQSAINAPRFRSMSMPASFAPHDAAPGTLLLETGLYTQSADGLRMLGYTVKSYPDWDNTFGAVGAVIKDGDKLLGGSDPREDGWAEGK